MSTEIGLTISCYPVIDEFGEPCDPPRLGLGTHVDLVIFVDGRRQWVFRDIDLTNWTKLPEVIADELLHECGYELVATRPEWRPLRGGGVFTTATAQRVREEIGQ